MLFPRAQTSRGELRIHESLDDLSTDLAEYIAELSETIVKERGVFTIALSDGSLIDLLGKLAEAPFNTTVEWDRWSIYWADEHVPKTHADSNYRLAKDGLFSRVPVFSNHMNSIKGSLSAEKAASEYEYRIRQHVKTRLISASEISDCPKFDLILLGMGPDGHVASLFPDHSALGVTDAWVTFMTDSPKPPRERITFTLPVINSASNVAIVVTGGDKADAAHQAIDADVVGPSSTVSPARMVQPTEVKLVWFLDKQAASKLCSVQVSE